MAETCVGLGKFALGVARAKYCVLVAWAIAVLGVAPCAIMLIADCKLTLNAPPGSDAAIAMDALKQYFPEEALSTQFVLLVQAEEDVVKTKNLEHNDKLEKFSAELNVALNKTLDGQLHAFRSYFSLVAQKVPSFMAYSQLVSPDGQAMLIQWTMLGEAWDEHVLQFSTKSREIVEDLEKSWLQGEKLVVRTLSFPDVINGAVEGAISDLEKMDSIALPCAFIVLACIVRSLRLLLIPLCVMAASACLSFGAMFLLNLTHIMPVETFTPPMMMSILIAMSFDYSLFICTRIKQELQSINRGRQTARTVEADIANVIEATFSTAGFTILLSGLTLACSFAVLLFVPVGLISNFGIGCALALCITVFAAITIPSALLGAFPAFFANSGDTWRRCWHGYSAQAQSGVPQRTAQKGLRYHKNSINSVAQIPGSPWTSYDGSLSAASTDDLESAGRTVSSASASSALGPDISRDNSSSLRNSITSLPQQDSGLGLTASATAWVLSGSTGSATSLDAELLNAASSVSADAQAVARPIAADRVAAANGASETQGFWWKFARVMTYFPFNVLFLLMAAAFSIGVGAAMVTGEGFKMTSDLIADIPRGSNLHDAYTGLGESFGSGRMWPYTLLLVPPPQSGGVLNNVSWAKCQSILSTIAENPKLHRTSLQDFIMPFSFSGLPVPWYFVEPCVGVSSRSCQPAIGSAIQQFVNPEQTGVFGYINLPWDSLDSKHGQGWLNEMRRTLVALEKETSYKLYLGGYPTVLLDQSAVMWRLFPFVICGCLSVAFLVLAVAFKSILIPLRSMISILLTQAFVFGLAVLTFQYGIFDWVGIPGISSEIQGVEFHMPIAVFSIIVGLCLDYDIFLLTRTQEETAIHRDSLAGIRHGVVQTGSIITSAGIIMAFAFGGLLFSSMATMNQLGFFLVAAALYDTFVSRCILTPAMMSLFGDKNWWPGALYGTLREARLQEAAAVANNKLAEETFLNLM